MSATISQALKDRLNAAVPLLANNTAAGNEQFANVVIDLIQESFPPQVQPSATQTIPELREEIKWQGDEFNQIDSKVGITLGFILIFAGQLLALSTTRRVDLQPFLDGLNRVPYAYLWLYMLIGCIGASLFFGVWSRWPRDFRGSAVPLRPSGKPALSEATVFDTLYEAIAINRKTNESKSRYSKLCSLFAALSLLGVVILIAGSVYQLELAPHSVPSAPPMSGPRSAGYSTTSIQARAHRL